MEKIINRNKYSENFTQFRDLVELNEVLIKKLEENQYFGNHMKNIKVCN